MPGTKLITGDTEKQRIPALKELESSELYLTAILKDVHTMSSINKYGTIRLFEKGKLAEIRKMEHVKIPVLINSVIQTITVCCTCSMN